MTEETTGREKQSRGAAANDITKRGWAARDVIGSITGRKRAEEALRESEERWRCLVESIPDIIMTVDANGTILFINRTVLGFTVEGATGSKVYDYVPPEHHDTMRKQLEAVFEVGEAHDFEIGGAGPFGRTSWYFNRIGPVVQNGRVVAATLIATDISEKRRAEEALRESEEKYRDLVQNINEAIFKMDADGRITYITPAAEQAIGYPPSEIVGRPFADFFHPDDLSSAVQGFQRALSGHPTPNQYRLLSKTGEVIWVRSFGRPIFEGDRIVGVRGVLTDVTERKRAEEALRESEKRHRHLVENINEAIYELDANGQLTYISPVVEEATGYSPSEIVGRPATDFVHPDDVSRAVEGLQRAVSGNPTPNEYRLLTKTGNALWVRSFGRPILEGKRVVGVRGVLTDITERKRAEEELRESEERYRDIAENLNDAIFEFNTSGRMAYVSPGMEELSGHSASEMIGHPVTELVHPDDLASVIEKVQKRPFGDREPSEYRLLIKPGEVRWVRSLGLPIFEGDRVVGFRVVLTDITESKRAEEELRESEGRYRSLIEASPDAIALSDLNAEIIMVNEQAAKLLGFDRPEDMAGLSSFDFIAPEDRERAVENTRKALETGTARNTEYTILRKDGTRFPAEMSASLIVDAAGKPVAFTGVTRDITERRLAEVALRESEEKWRSLVENAPDIIMTVSADSTILSINHTVPGLTVDSVIGTSLYDYVPREHHDTIRVVHQRVFETAEPQSYEIAGAGPAGRTSWYFSRVGPIVRDGTVVAAILITTDITKQRRAEEALRESEARLRAFANAVPDVAFILDENGLYVEVLAAPDAKDLLYANGDTLKGQRLHDVLPKKSADQFLSVVRKTIETQEPQIVEYVLDVQAGRRWFEGRTAPLSLPGENQAVVWLSHDITERKQAEARREKAREELDRKVERAAKRASRYGLSFRELTVLDLVSTGKSDRDIATVLGIRPRTVSKHVENIRAKMGASSRTEAGVRAIKEKLLG